MNEFTRQYLITALWSSLDEDDEPLDKNYDIEDLSEEAIKIAEDECNLFIAKVKNIVDIKQSNVPHDFWLTRNGHGAGFWDGDYEESLGKELTEISKAFGECDLYIGDDGKIHLSSNFKI